MLEKDALATGHQFKCNRTVHKMKMPKCGSCIDLFPNVADARNRRIQQGELFDLGGKLRGISIGHHHPDVVTDEIDIFVPKARNQLMDIDGCSFLVIAGSLSRRLAQAAQIRSNYCVISAKIREERKPHPSIITEAVYQYQRRLAAAGLEVMKANTIHICKEGIVVWFCRNACTAGLN